jgi:uncharacterized membrane protein
MMWWGYGGFHPFPWIFLVVIAFVVIFRVVMFRRYGCRHHRRWEGGPDDALSILDRRLVNGEVTEEEYRRLKAILTK